MSREMDDSRQLLQDIRAAFAEAANSAKAAPMAAYMKGIAPFSGIKSPQRKVIERQIFAATKTLPFSKIESLIHQLVAQPERELHYLATDWLHHRRKEWTAETIGLIEGLITTKSWWDTVDFLAVHCLGGWARRWPAEGLKAVQRATHSGHLWLERSAIIHQLTYKGKTDTHLLAETILPHIRSKEFFRHKAIGWALREYARTNAGWVQRFAAMRNLMPLSKREALKHL